MKLSCLRSSCVFALSTVAAAAGAETGPYYLGGYVGYTHLSNVLGLADGQQPPANYPSRSDKVSTVALIAGLDQPISRQRVFGDVIVRRNELARNSRLSNTGYTLNAGLDWETVGHLSGEIVAKGNRELLRYSPTEQPGDRANLVTTKQLDAVARLGGVTQLSFELGGGGRSLDFSEPSYAPRENRVSYGSLGVRWSPRQATSLGIAYRDTNGRYPGYSVNGSAAPDRFDRRDVDLTARFELSGLTSVSARLSATQVDYQVQDDDFDGTTGYLRASWTPGAKLKLSGEIARDRGSDIAADSLTQFTTPKLVTVTRLRADWAASAKLAFNAGASHYRRPVTQLTRLFPFEFTEQGRERSTQYSLGAAWTPTRTSRIGCDWTKEKRRGDVSSTVLDVSSGSFGCSAQLTIQP